MTHLGNGLSNAECHEDALSVKEAELAMMRRIGAPEENVLVVQANLANTYDALGRREDALRMSRDVYSGWLKLHGEESEENLGAAHNYANSLLDLKRFEEGKALLRRMLPVARGVLGDSNRTTLMTRWNYAGAICNDTTATLAELREAVNTLEEVERTARRVLGGSHPLTRTFEDHLRDTRVALAAREDVSKKLKTRRLAQKSIHQTSIRPGCCPAPKCCPPRRRRRSRDGLLLQQACRRRAG